MTGQELEQLFQHRPATGRRSLGQLCFVRLPYLITGTLFLVAVLVNIANVIGRYVFSKPIFWAEEVLAFIIVWAVFIAAATITYRGEHIGMDLFFRRFPTPLKRIVSSLIAVAFVATTAIVVVQSWKVIELFLKTGDKSIATEVPLIVPHSAILVGFGLMLLAVVLRLPNYIRGNSD